MAKRTTNVHRQQRSSRGTFTGLIDEVLARTMHRDYAERSIGYTQLAKHYGFSKSSIYEAFKRYDLPTRLVKSSKPNAQLVGAIAALYAEGKTLPEIRTALGLRMQSRVMVMLLRQEGVTIRTRREEEARRWKAHRKKIPLIIKAYKEGTGVPTLAKRYNVNPSFCYTWLRRNGITIRHSNDPIYAQLG